MKKLIIGLALIASASMYAQDLTYNCRLENEKEVKIKDTIKRKIRYNDKEIIFENYFIDSEFDFDDKNLVLNIDSIVEKNRLRYTITEDWYYCSGPGGKYIAIGLGTSYISLYFLASEVDVFEEIFQALKE